VGEVSRRSQCGLAVDFTTTKIHAEYVINTPVIKMDGVSLGMAYPCAKGGSAVGTAVVTINSGPMALNNMNSSVTFFCGVKADSGNANALFTVQFISRVGSALRSHGTLETRV